MKFSVKGFFSKCDEIRRKLRIWSYLLKNSLMENFIFCSMVGIIWKIFKGAGKTYTRAKTVVHCCFSLKKISLMQSSK